MADQWISGDSNIQVLVKESENVHIEVNRTRVASFYVPPFRQEPRPSRTQDDLSLLLATTSITNLTGREPLWQSCLAWCNDAALDPLSVRCLTGRGGSGKSRFSLEFVHHLRELPDWDARFVRFEKSEPFDLWAKTSGKRNVLLVFDYASDNAAAIADSLRAFVENPPADPRRRLRVLLLARTACWDSGWLAQFQPRSTLEYSQRLSYLFDPELPIELEPLSPDDRVSVFEQAYAVAAEQLRLPTQPMDRSVFQTPHADETLKDPLTLIMAAVVALRNGVPNALSLSRLELAHEAADLLVAQRLEHSFPENPALALHMAAYATLIAGLPREDALAVLKTEFDANSLGAVQNPSGFLERLSSWLPGKNAGDLLGAIEPDIVGEAFLLGRSVPRLVHPEPTILRAVQKRDAQTIQFLIRSTQDFCLAEKGIREEPLKWLGILIAEGQAQNTGLLLQIEASLPESSVVLRSHAYSMRYEILGRLLYLVDTQTEQAEASLDLSSTLARYLAKFSVSQSEAGLRDEALATAQEAATLRRQLAQRNRDAFLPALAMSLNNLANRQSEAGLRDEALATAQEAATLRRQLVLRNRDAFLPALASSLNNLAVMQSEAGLRDEALATAQEAATLRRQLAQRNRDAFLPALASSLNNLAAIQSDAGLRDEALATAQEAATLYGQLAQHNRDAFLPDLAMSLHNLATRQSEAGLRDEALATAQEAATLNGQLAQRNRDAFLPALASSLNNLAPRQSQAGLRDEALATAQEAATLYGQLAQRNRDAFLPDLAMSLNNLANRQSEAGLRDEALATAQEAAALYGQLAQRNRDAFLPDLASSLNNLATRQSEAGLRDEALVTAQEAATLGRQLAQRNRDAFLPDLASSLHNLATRQSEAGLRDEALATAQEAATLYGQLAQRNRDAFLPDLAMSCGTLGSIHRNSGNFAEATQAFAEGLTILLPHIETRPFQPLIQLAVNLCRDCIGAAEQGGLATDEQMMTEASRVLGPHLNRQGESPND